MAAKKSRGKRKHKQTPAGPKLNAHQQQRIQILFQQATSHHQTGQLNQAKQLYQEILKIHPKHADCLHLLGLILAEQGDSQAALQAINQAIILNPKFAAFYLNRGLIYKRLNKVPEAIADYQHTIYLDPNFLKAYCELGDVLFKLEKFDKAINTFQAALRLDPKYINALNNMGNIYLAKEEYQKAVQCYQKVLVIDNNCIAALSNIGVGLVELGNIEEAIANYKKALSLDPKYIQAYINLGLAYNRLHKFAEAEIIYQKALNIDTTNAELYSHLGIIYKEQGKLDNALACFKKALTIQPNSPTIQFNQAICLLLAGNFIEGWKKYETRFNLKEHLKTKYHFTQPLWCGENFFGKTLFIHVEQGLGDMLQFIRYLPMVKARGGRVILECQAELFQSLQDNNINVDQLIPRGSPPQQFDYHIAIMSLAHIFKTTLDNIPQTSSYLIANYHHPIRYIIPFPITRYNVGIVWAGGSLHKNDHNRSIDLKSFTPLLENKLIGFYSLQYGEHATDISRYNLNEHLIDLSPYIKDFSDTAAIIDKLNLVITVDTAIAHLSAAMGKPTWILLPYAPDFRWLLGKADSPWYKSVKLFRQTIASDWSSVIKQLDKNLAQEQKKNKSSFFTNLIKNQLNKLPITINSYNQKILPYWKKVQAEPKNTQHLGNLVRFMQSFCIWDELDYWLQQLKSIAQKKIGDNQLCQPFNYLAIGLSAQEQLSIAKNIACHHFTSLDPLRAKLNFNFTKQAKQKIRIGYVSGDIRNHATAHLIMNMFAHHDRSKFEIYLYSIGPKDGSVYCNHIPQLCDRYQDLLYKNIEECATQIYQDNIDILIDVMGYTQYSRPQIFELKPAPLQISFLAFPGTMGCDFINYLITDQVVVPAENTRCYTENLLYMPNSYFVTDDQQTIAATIPTKTECGLPENKFIFCCFNRTYKLEAKVFAIWMQILKRIPNSVLWLYADVAEAKQNLYNEAEKRKISKDRIIFAEVTSKDKHLARHKLADLFLDCFAINAHTTAIDALWAGVPVISILGDSIISRASASILSAMQLSELIAKNEQHYAKLAIYYAHNKKALLKLKQKLTMHRNTAPLFNTKIYVKHLEQGFIKIWEHYLTSVLDKAGTTH